MKIKEGDPTLLFESRFETGNLDIAVKLSDSEYQLLLQVDINTNGHTQWFYFSIGNIRKSNSVKFNIMNFIKPNSLFNEGMKVLLYSETENKRSGRGWFRGGRDISYFCNGYQRPNKTEKFFYTLSFTLDFEYDDDTVHLAYAYPYTYSDLLHDLDEIESDYNKSMFVSRQPLCRTLAGNRCDYLTISARSQPRNKNKSALIKKGVVLSGRVHPGETNGSWMMKGAIDFLTG